MTHLDQSSADRSRMRNAARDMANAYNAFEKASERLIRASRELSREDQTLALQEGCDSPDRARALAAISSKLPLTQ